MTSNYQFIRTLNPIITPPPLLARQNADCSNSIAAAVESATVVVSRSFQQSLATVSQQLQQASIAASNAIQQASVASASASSFVAGASVQIASLSTSASVAVASASLSLVAVMESAMSVEASASSAVASAQAALAAASGLGMATQTMTPATNMPTNSSIVPHTSPSHKTKLTPPQIALVVIGSMLASIFITLLISFLLLRHKKQAKQAQLQKDKHEQERMSQPPPLQPLPIAASMSKRAPDKSMAHPLPSPERRVRVHEEAPAQIANPEMTAAIGFAAFHPEGQEDAFAGQLRDRLARLSSQQDPLITGPQDRLYIPPSPPSPLSASTGTVQQAKQVSFSTIRAVESMPVRLSEEEVDEGFTVSRTVMRSASKEKGGGVKIGVRTWVESGTELS
ncbi:hypothetical protein N431DRAFT_548920 [Stipitochalara longipes BDJ]|nr:hypothetical protein N431DRAFT_548920 [Stipitochalara longipes BDJ]